MLVTGSLVANAQTTVYPDSQTPIAASVDRQANSEPSFAG